MRRLLASVAFVAVTLVLPATASAVGTTLLTTAAFTNGPRVLTWTDVPDAVAYRVLRAPADCSGPTDISGDLGIASPHTYTDSTSPPEGVYCYIVETQGLLPTDVSDSSPVLVTYDVTAPTVTSVTEVGADGCTPGAPFTVTGATATDFSPVTFTVSIPPQPSAALPPSFVVPGAPFETVTPVVVATDAAGNSSPPFSGSPGHVNDPTPPGPVTLEVSTDPSQQQATLTWDPVPNDAVVANTYRLRTKGPQGTGQSIAVTSPVTQQNLSDDATYEFTLEAVDECGRTSSSVRLVRLSDSTPPTMPLLANPGFNPAAHTVALSWVPSSDNIQVDHYIVLRDGVPLGATDATGFSDPVPPQHAVLHYSIRAVDTNGNATDSAPAVLTTPDWTPPSAPLPTLTTQGSSVSLHWPPATDNVGVVGYDVLRDDRQVARMTAVLRAYRDVDVPPGVHTWRVVARDDAGLTASSAPISRRISKATARASVLALRKVGGGTGAARYSLAPRGRLLVDVRVIGTLAKPRLRVYVHSGRRRITVWRGVPGTSAPRLRLGSALARRGFMTIRLNRALHAGHIRLVLIAGGHVVIAGKGAHRPALKAG